MSLKIGCIDIFSVYFQGMLLQDTLNTMNLKSVFALIE